MKRSNVIGILAAAAVIVLSVVLISWYLTKRTPTLIQGTVECTTYKASSKVPGRIDDMKVEEGDRVEKGQLLYTLSTPELDAKLQQAEAVKSAAAALDAGRRSRCAHPADRSRAEHVGEGPGGAGTGTQDLRARAEPLQRRGGARPEAGRSLGQLQGDGGDGAGRQSAVRPGLGRSPQGGQGGRSGACPPGRRRRQRGRVVPQRRNGLLRPSRERSRRSSPNRASWSAADIPWWRSST